MKGLTKHIHRRSVSLLLTFCVLAVFVRCSQEFLEAKPNKNLAVPVTLQDFQGMLDNINVFTFASTIYRGEIASDGHSVTDAVFQNRAKGVQTDSYIWSKTVQHSSTASNWATPYSKILYSNIILDGLKNSTSEYGNDKLYQDIKGQALFQRAITFYELAQIYSPVYDKTTLSGDLGIVMRLSSDINIPSTRSSLRETYDQILSDLMEAKDLLPERPLALTRASKLATLALLARVYLSVDDYSNAFMYANECLQLNSNLLDYNSIPSSANFIGRYNSEVLFHQNQVDNFLTTNYLIDRDFYNLYHPDDLRKTRLFRVNTNQTISFKGNYEGNATNIFCGLATDEVYLIRAECYAREGKVTEAMKDLNDLIKMRWDNTKTYPVITANDAEDALRTVLLERRKELVNRGIRWSDLRRLNKDSRFAVTLTRTVGGVTYTLEPNSYKYTFPIPDDVIQQTGIAQNPGWTN